jgi:SAM-dependent methyltransferase
MKKEIIFKVHPVSLKGLENPKTDLSKMPVFDVIRNIFNSFLSKPLENYKIVDLGCMEGGYTLEFAKMGFQKVVGIDARKENLLKANMLKLSSRLNNLDFILDDARNIGQHGIFDVTFCFGLLYHLNDPAAFLKKLYQQTNHMLVLHSYTAPEHGWAKKRRELLSNKSYYKQRNAEITELAIKNNKFLGYIQYPVNQNLSPKKARNEGFEGHWFEEYKATVSHEDIEKMPGASYNNYRSFWFFKPELIKALYAAGFESVMEVHDYIGDMKADYPDDYFPRTLLVALKKHSDEKQ